MAAKIVAVVAIGKNSELGKEGKLLWHIPDDLKRFKALTRGPPIIRGRKPFESVVGYLGKPLPERTNIVISHQGRSLVADGVIVVPSLVAAIEKARELASEEVNNSGGV